MNKINLNKLKTIEQRRWNLWRFVWMIVIILSTYIVFDFILSRGHTGSPQNYFLMVYTIGLLLLVFLCILYIRDKEKKIGNLRKKLFMGTINVERLLEVTAFSIAVKDLMEQLEKAGGCDE